MSINQRNHYNTLWPDISKASQVAHEVPANWQSFLYHKTQLKHNVNKNQVKVSALTKFESFNHKDI